MNARETPEAAGLVMRRDGKYEEPLGDNWTAEYSANQQTGLWDVEVFKHDVAEWREVDIDSLEEARRAARDFYDQA